MKETKITRKQERFCQEYMLDHNATRAAIRSGYSEDTAASIGSENLKKPDIMKRIAELEERNGEYLDLTKADIYHDLQDIVSDRLLPAAVRLRAIELKGKLIGAFSERLSFMLDKVEDQEDGMYISSKEWELLTDLIGRNGATPEQLGIVSETDQP